MGRGKRRQSGQNGLGGRLSEDLLKQTACVGGDSVQFRLFWEGQPLGVELCVVLFFDQGIGGFRR